MTIEEIRTNAPKGATHYLHGNYYRIEDHNKMIVFHKCGGCCYDYHGNDGCGENNQWSKYTSGYLDDSYVALDV